MTKRQISPSKLGVPLPKRSKGDEDNDDVQEREVKNNYQGYSFQTRIPDVEIVDPEIDAKKFFDGFVAVRKPCVIRTLNHPPSVNIIGFDSDELVKISGNEVRFEHLRRRSMSSPENATSYSIFACEIKTVQVEKRDSLTVSFGQNRTSSRQILMTIKEFVEKLHGEDGDLFYLSTQQPPTTDDEDPGKTSAAFQIPCAQLLEAKKIDQTVSWAGNLRLESCNLWMGSSRRGSSSGLHHDYHDNFYMLLQGRKRFRLYSPDTAPYMSTYGSIDQIHFNGLISYVGNETGADGVPLAMPENDEDEQTDEAESEDDEEEIILGKGFDYQTSDEDNDVDEGTHDDFDKIMGSDSDTGASGEPTSEEEQERPNSFSRIDPDAVNDKDYPLFARCNEYVVDLEAGDSLFLPAGWFHCVTSFGSEKRDEDDKKGSIHLALNYWYHPPDQLQLFEKPYAREPGSRSGNVDTL
jgi:hypothetical protein